MKALLLPLLGIAGFNTHAQDSTSIGRVVPDIRLRNVDGRTLSFAGFPEAKGFIVVFTCNHCPFAKLYSDRLNDLQARYSHQGVPLLAINSMDTLVYSEESFALMQERAKNEGFTFPYLYDDLQRAGKAFGAEHTPHAFVIWKERGVWVIRYSGAIDDNGQEPDKATPFVANAVDGLLLNGRVRTPVTTSFGCRIFYRK